MAVRNYSIFRRSSAVLVLVGRNRAVFWRRYESGYIVAKRRGRELIVSYEETHACSEIFDRGGYNRFLEHFFLADIRIDSS